MQDRRESGDPSIEAEPASRRPGRLRRLVALLEGIELLVQAVRLVGWLLRGLWLAAGALVRAFGDR
ncbi:MAG: hypothetical protein EKK43_22000 [Methylobacterium sp.]|uniref:hypothetical protein n=1 Tax=Methylobacterium sp. TaxID=409 RepID=UPI000FA2E778|nr:hypothetical protein [Methylobacterium sp.]RUP12385.1 MAG: hypothetical protein EKK43_22000 [Methylobacterium sp.]